MKLIANVGVMMVGENGAWGGDVGRGVWWDLVGFGWGIIVFGSGVFIGVVLVFCLIIYIYFIVYISGYWFVLWVSGVGLEL